MRFYVKPIDQGVTTCINFDHVVFIRIENTIVIQLLGVEQPLSLPKTVANLSLIAKGMDLSDTSREALCNLAEVKA